MKVKTILRVIGGIAMVSTLSFATAITFQNVPIISSSGQPVVQIVVGSHSAPSDGVVAGNIAAVIGNLAYASMPVTATVQGTSAVKCVPATTAKCTVTNQQVWLGESGVSVPNGSYGFTALIGSVLNRAVKLGIPQGGKTLSNNTQYTYPNTNSTVSSPVSEAFYGTSVPVSIGVTSNYNGGGVSFSGFGTNHVNIMRITNAEVPSLVSNFGPGSENEYLWITGFPVYDQNAKSFALLDAGGALQLVFNKPIPLYSSINSNTVNYNNAVINIAGQNWTIVNGTAPKVTLSSSTTFVQGGSLTLAQSMTPLETVNVSSSISSGPFKVVLEDLSHPNNAGVSSASINVYYNGQLINTTSITPPGIVKFNVSGQTLWVKVNQTFAGLYAYEKWAKMQLFSNEYTLTNGQAFNKTTNPGWNVFLDWVNTTGSGSANDLQSIVIYNTSPIQTLLPGQSFTFLKNPAVWKLTLVKDTLATGDFDPLTIDTKYVSSLEYQNVGAGSKSWAPKNLTEPAQLLIVKSSIPTAFNYEGITNNTIEYDLTPYSLVEFNNATTLTGGNSVGVNAMLVSEAGNFIGTQTNPTLSVMISGYPSKTSPSPTTQSIQLNSTGNSVFVGNFFNITDVRVSEAVPGLEISFTQSTNPSNVLAIFSEPASAGILYPVSSQNYPNLDLSYQSISYNQGNGQPTAQFIMNPFTVGNGATGQHAYFNYTIEEYPVPTNSTAVDKIGFDIVNSSIGSSAVMSNLFQLNYSMTSTNVPGVKNNVTYISTQGSTLNAPQGFITEKGSEISSITPTSLTFDLAKSVDTLLFTVGPVNTTIPTTEKTFGPFNVGEATNIPNVTIAKVNATCSFSSNVSMSCSVVGLNNVTAKPSINETITPYKLNTATNPLVVLDTDANPSMNQIVIGSKFVNSVAQQIFAENPSLNSSFGPNSVIVKAFGNKILVAGYYANQTVQAGNEFIEDLLSQASS